MTQGRELVFDVCHMSKGTPKAREGISDISEAYESCRDVLQQQVKTMLNVKRIDKLP